MTLENVQSAQIPSQASAVPGPYDPSQLQVPPVGPALSPGLLFADHVAAAHHHHHPQQSPRALFSPADDTTQSDAPAEQLEGEWSPEISRYGLTSSSKFGDRSFVAVPRSRSAALSGAAPEYWSDTESGTSLASKTGAKRPAEDESQDGSRSVSVFKSPLKKARLAAPGRLRLPALPQAAGDLVGSKPETTSPLFFSNSPKFLASRPPSFPPVEVTASMMSGVQETQDGVTTLRLPKGQVTSSSPARSSSTSGSWPSTEVAGASRSPEGRTFLSPILQQLQGVGVIEFLEQDDRPTFIVDLSNPTNFGAGPLHVIFANASLRASQPVQELLQADTSDPTHSPEFSRFKAWILNFVKNSEAMDICLPSMSYGGISWTCSTVRRRFRVVSGNTSAVSITPTLPSPIAQASSVLDQRARGPTPGRDPDTPKERPAAELDYFTGADRVITPTYPSRAHSEPGSKPESLFEVPVHASDDLVLDIPEMEDLRTTFDWTRIPLDTPNLTDHIRFARSVDWESTPLGPVEHWTADLRSMSNMIMGSPHPAAMYWGPEYTAIYNEAYITIAGQRHPSLMGTSYRDAWSEIWDEIQPVFENAWNYGQAMMKHDDRLFVTRNGFLEETFFNWSIVPLVGSDGSVVALYNPGFDNTRRKLSERRMHTLRELGEKTSEARDVKGFWGQVQKGLEYNEFDVPFALIYSVSEDSESEVSSMHSGSVLNPPQIVLEGSLGVPPGHPVAVTNIDLKTSEAGFAPHMRESMQHASTPIVLRRDDGSLASNLIEGLAWRGFGDPCRTIVVFPVHPTTAGDTVVGFIVLGVNPRRPYDEDYKLFVNLVSRQLATSLASVVLFEEEIRRGQRAAQLAALDRQELSLQLRLRTQEAVESEYRFSRMAAFGPVGMFITDGQGRITYCNDMWWKISGHERTTSTIDSWMQSIRDEDRLGVEAAWRRLVNDKIALTHEFRFKGSRQIIDGHSVDTWVLMSAYPERNEVGDLKSIFGCLTDISQQKWAEDFQKQRREEAVEMKRQQENFIDITSHEMRNPLSAILQCADEISSSITRYKTGDSMSYTPGTLNMLLDSCVEASSTISLCASHQKRIVDDILTLSKLDSQLLLVTPVDVQPITVVQNVLRMFEPELTSNNIAGEFLIEDSYRELDIDWVKMDPSRMRQVLINLMTNAIKFTQGRTKRSIVISLAASKHQSETGLSFIPSRNGAKDITDRADWGDGEKVNVHVAVKDTGPGLDDAEKKILFQRFSQATPRTHVQYGGSGLGLFICRTLTELQGGQIGVESRKGVGSTFAFYIKARKVANPHPDPSATVPTPRSSPAKLPPSATALNAPSQQIQQGLYSSELAGSGAGPGTELITLPQIPPSPSGSTISVTPPFDVLIVEDNLVNQKVLQRQLILSGNNTLVANHGGEALETLSRSRFWAGGALSSSSPSSTSSTSMGPPTINISVILMDLEMPIMDGMTCARKIRELEADGTIVKHIPIIAVTAYARPEQIESAKAAGMDDVISKPFRIPELIPKIEELVARYHTLSITPVPTPPVG